MMLIRAIATALGLMGALMASQIPEFVQQYRQRLGGAIDELARAVSRFDADALANKKTRGEALDELGRNPNDLVRRRGSDAAQNILRLDALEGQRRTMREAGPFTRMVHFLRYADDGLVHATLKDFEPAVPTTSEGLVAACVGFVGGWGATRLLCGWAWRWRERRKLRPRPVQQLGRVRR